MQFTYPARPDVQILFGVSLVIEPGTTVALVGQSGSGKSTIIQLLERFYDPVAGSVEVDGIPIPQLNLLWLRRQIGFVSQEPTLFEGTVAQNVAHGLIGSAWESESASAKMERIVHACRQANAHDFILKLPQGYDTPVGERGLLLSGGQKQRICIARSIVKDPKILLLDEATSALDTTSERIVQDALDRASKGRTTVVIAHRLSTIMNADKIVVMGSGQIVESGTHQSLLAQPDSVYKRFVEAQKLAAEKQADEKKENVDPDEVVNLPRSDTRTSEKSKHSSLPRSNRGSKKDLEIGDEDKQYSTWTVVKEIIKLNYPELKWTIPGLFASIFSGLVYPLFAIAFGTIIQVFSETGDKLINDSNFWALMFVFIAILNLVANFCQVISLFESALTV